MDIPSAEETSVMSQRDMVIDAVKSLRDGVRFKTLTLQEHPDQGLIDELVEKGYQIRYTSLFDTGKAVDDRFVCHLTVINPKIRGNQCDLAQMFQESMEKLGVKVQSDVQFKDLFQF